MALAFSLTVAATNARFVPADPRHLEISTFEYEDLDACKRFADSLCLGGNVIAFTIEGDAGVVVEWELPAEAAT